MKFEKSDIYSNLEGRMRKLKQALDMDNKELILKEIHLLIDYLTKLREIVEQ